MSNMPLMPLQRNAKLTDFLKLATLHPTPYPRAFCHGNFEALPQENHVEILRVDLHLNRTIKSNCDDGTFILYQKSGKRLKTGRLKDRQPNLREDNFFSGGCSTSTQPSTSTCSADKCKKWSRFEHGFADF